MRLPAKMKAAAIDRFGPPSVLKLGVVPVPEVGPNEVLIAVHTAGVGYWDARIRDGSWAERKRFPQVLGTDGAGLVAAKGSRVRRFRLDERVWAFQYDTAKGGFYAEYVAVAANNVAATPRRLDLVQAGAASVTALTALQGIDDQLKLRRGETVFIFGASGAVGTLAVQFAKRRRARVLAAASGRDAARLVKRLGADEVIDAHTQAGLARLRTLAPEGIDAVLALAGGDALERCLDLVRPGGRIVYANGVEPEPRRRPKIRRIGYDVEVGPREYARLARAVEQTRLRVPIAAKYPLARAAQAHARLEKGHVLGRIVLRVRR